MTVSPSAGCCRLGSNRKRHPDLRRQLLPADAGFLCCCRLWPGAKPRDAGTRNCP